jgi:hypothetical protein
MRSAAGQIYPLSNSLRQILREDEGAKGDSMAVKISITRENGKVRFESVTVLDTDNVFFVNFDTEAGHHPDLLPPDEPLGPAPPPAQSIQVAPRSSYICTLHNNEQGTITIIPT